MQIFPFPFIVIIFILFCFAEQQIKRDVFKDPKKLVKKTVNPFKPNAFLWVIGTQ